MLYPAWSVAARSGVSNERAWPKPARERRDPAAAQRRVVASPPFCAHLLDFDGEHALPLPFHAGLYPSTSARQGRAHLVTDVRSPSLPGRGADGPLAAVACLGRIRRARLRGRPPGRAPPWVPLGALP